METLILAVLVIATFMIVCRFVLVVGKLLVAALLAAVGGALGCGFMGALLALAAVAVGAEVVETNTIVGVCAVVGGIFGVKEHFLPTKKSGSKNKVFSSTSTSPVSTYNFESLPELESPAGYVYVIEDKDRPGMYKIGRTKNPKRRLQQITSNTGSELDYLRLIRANDAKREEKRLHQQYGYSRRAGEWFKLSDSEAKNIR